MLQPRNSTPQAVALPRFKIFAEILVVSRIKLNWRFYNVVRALPINASGTDYQLLKAIQNTIFNGEIAVIKEDRHADTELHHSILGEQMHSRENCYHFFGISGFSQLLKGIAMDCLCCKKNIPTNGQRICPECNQPFEGYGCTGIDAHWRTKHENVMSYETFRDSLCKNHRHSLNMTKSGVQYAHQYIRFIAKHGVGQNDSIANSTESYLSYLHAVSGLIGNVIAPDILKSEEDVLKIAQQIKGKRASATISNYCSAMRQYVSMLKVMEQSPVLTYEVISAWDETVHRYNHTIPADKSGPFSINALISRLAPIREHLKEAVARQLPDYPRLSDSKPHCAYFWGRGRMGAVMKGNIWNYLASDKLKTSARLQMTFTYRQTVTAEYVAYPASEKNRKYDISGISKALQNETEFLRFRTGLARLSPGFSIRCTTGEGKKIGSDISDITNAEWAALHNSGVDVNSYFVIGTDMARDKLFDLTIDQLATLLLEDIDELVEIRDIFKGKPSMTPKTTTGISPIIARARSTSLRPPNNVFHPEFAGTTTYATPKNTVEASRRHGTIANKLAVILSQKNLYVGNDLYRDVFILAKDKSIRVLFEIKTDTATSSIYSAIGQLLLHGSAQEQKPSLVAVLPGKPNQRTALAFSKLGIHHLTYELDKGISFPNLDILLSEVGLETLR